MDKFAKLFDVADTQVLFMITTDDDGDVTLKMTTVLHDMEVSQFVKFKHDDQDAMQVVAQKALAALNQESADKFHQKMLGFLSD